MLASKLFHVNWSFAISMMSWIKSLQKRHGNRMEKDYNIFPYYNTIIGGKGI